MLGLFIWGREEKEAPVGSVGEGSHWGSVSRASGESVECTQWVPHKSREEAGVFAHPLGDTAGRLPGCGVGGLLAKAFGLASSPASPEGTSNCLLAIWTGRVFSSLDSGTVPVCVSFLG